MVLRLSVKYKFPYSIFVGQDSLKMELLTNWLLTKWQGLSYENQSLYRPNVFQSNIFRAKVAEPDKCSVLSSAKQLLFLIGTIISFVRKKYQSRPQLKIFLLLYRCKQDCSSLSVTSTQDQYLWARYARPTSYAMFRLAKFLLWKWQRQ